MSMTALLKRVEDRDEEAIFEIGALTRSMRPNSLPFDGWDDRVTAISAAQRIMTALPELTETMNIVVQGSQIVER